MLASSARPDLGAKRRNVRFSRRCRAVFSVAMSEVAASYRRIYSVVSRIPRGRVATYGQVARLAGIPGQARLVGYALSALDDRSRVPWHRVVNAEGRISPRRDGSPAATVQRLRLDREHVRFDARRCIRLDLFRWRPR
jgi:methylated-DNA-protein-cysteine methyltransferase related protein